MKRVHVVAVGLLAFAVLWGVGCGDKSQTASGISVYQAAETGDIGTIRSAIKGGFKINTPDAAGMTVLHHAAASGQANLVESLTEQFGASRMLTTKDGKTAADLAQENNHPEIARMLKAE